MRILVVEDEKKTASFICKAPQAVGFLLDVCPMADDALAAVSATPFDGVVLDIMLPGPDGLSVLRQLRGRRNTTPVLLLSARGEVDERVDGLNAGADDYLPKPFVIAEWVARVRARGGFRSGERRPVGRVGNQGIATGHVLGRRWHRGLSPKPGPRTAFPMRGFTSRQGSPFAGPGTLGFALVLVAAEVLRMKA